MEAVRSSETSVDIYRTTQQHTPADNILCCLFIFCSFFFTLYLSPYFILLFLSLPSFYTSPSSLSLLFLLFFLLYLFYLLNTLFTNPLHFPLLPCPLPPTSSISRPPCSLYTSLTPSSPPLPSFSSFNFSFLLFSYTYYFEKIKRDTYYFEKIKKRLMISPCCLSLCPSPCFFKLVRLPCRLCVCVPLNLFALYSALVVSEKSRRLFLPRISCSNYVLRLSSLLFLSPFSLDFICKFKNYNFCTVLGYHSNELSSDNPLY
jgi:hypothetical protein